MSKRKHNCEDVPAVSNDHIAKRRKDYTAPDAELAQCYRALSSEASGEREKAVRDITTLVEEALQQIQDGSTSALVDLDQPRNVFVRLIRGCCSGREAANHGFSDALANCLKASVAYGRLRHSILDMIEALTTPGDDSTRPVRLLIS